MKKQRPLVEHMAAHIASLIDAHDLGLVPITRGGRANRKARRVKLAPVKSVVTYAVALHELGHVLGSGQSRPRLEKEANAWQWAVQVALPGSVDKRFQATARRALNSYLTWAIGRSYRKHPPCLPPASHIFWKLARVKPPRTGVVCARGAADRDNQEDS